MITVTTRAEVRATTTGTVEMTLSIRVLTSMPADAGTTQRLLCPSLTGGEASPEDYYQQPRPSSEIRRSKIVRNVMTLPFQASRRGEGRS